MDANVERPKHPMHALTTFELRDYRRQLEAAIAFFDQQDPVPPARADLQAALALARAGSPVHAPILAHMAAVDAELANRADQQT